MNFEIKNLIYRIFVVTLILVISIIVVIASATKFIPEENEEVMNSDDISVKTAVNLPIPEISHWIF